MFKRFAIVLILTLMCLPAALAAVGHRLAEHTNDALSHVGVSWSCPATRENANAFDCATEGSHYEVLHGLVGGTLTTDTISIDTPFADYDLSAGQYTFEIRVVDNWTLMSEYSDPLNAEIVPRSPPSIIDSFIITVDGVVSVRVAPQ